MPTARTTSPPSSSIACLENWSFKFEDLAAAFAKRLVGLLNSKGGLKFREAFLLRHRERVVDFLESLSSSCDEFYQRCDGFSDEAVQHALYLFDLHVQKCGDERLCSDRTADLMEIERTAITCYFIARKIMGRPICEMSPRELIEVARCAKCGFDLTPRILTFQNKWEIRKWELLVENRRDLPNNEQILKCESQILQNINWKVRRHPPFCTRRSLAPLGPAARAAARFSAHPPRAL